ncbi:hypothetical protein SAMN02910358_00333 [Lachnospiraceae bacterium XBB1006]|nr:hypothetical protein SAMN02910358_00333 [Lachnospiraceae bacterium XBB1006]
MRLTKESGLFLGGVVLMMLVLLPMSAHAGTKTGAEPLVEVLDAGTASDLDAKVSLFAPIEEEPVVTETSNVEMVTEEKKEEPGSEQVVVDEETGEEYDASDLTTIEEEPVPIADDPVKEKETTLERPKTKTEELNEKPKDVGDAEKRLLREKEKQAKEAPAAQKVEKQALVVTSPKTGDNFPVAWVWIDVVSAAGCIFYYRKVLEE